MLLKVLIGLGFVLVVFLIYVSTRDGRFHYERSGVINASAEKIFPYITDFRLGQQWSPYAKMDPDMKATFLGQTGEVGSALEWEGNKSGSGKLEITGLVPNELVELRLQMFKPIKADNRVEYRLTPEAEGTRFSWSMSGDGGFIGKLMEVFMDCEKLVAGPFEDGIRNLKNLIESDQSVAGKDL